MKKRIDVALGIVLSRQSRDRGDEADFFGPISQAAGGEVGDGHHHLWKILITRRPQETVYGGYWEFPGGKIESDESPEQAVRRELEEELNIQVEVNRALTAVCHDYPHARVRLYPYCCTLIQGDVQNLGVMDHRWVWPEQLADYTFPQGNIGILQELMSFMGRIS